MELFTEVPASIAVPSTLKCLLDSSRVALTRNGSATIRTRSLTVYYNCPGSMSMLAFASIFCSKECVTSFTTSFLAETVEIISALSTQAIEDMAQGLATVRDNGGRLFVLGVGGSAGHAGHAVNDFRKICSFEAYAPTDNVSELTARTNDDGWETVFVEWLKGSRLNARDALLVFSVGGGSQAKNISANLVRALELAKHLGTKIYGIVGRDGGFTADVADVAVIVSPLYPERVTPHTEGLAAVIWHLLVSHPALKQVATTWESRK